jgi:dipeptidyl aminopeptidase/acylaminoacyl peptidase
MRALFLLLTLGLTLAGQPKRPITFADYETWKAISGQTLTADGKWLAYALMPQAGDGEVIAKELASGKEIRIPVGTPPRREDTDGENAEERGPAAPRGPRLVFSADGRFLVAQTFPRKADSDAARKARKKAADMPKGGMAVLALASGAVTRIENVKSFAVPETGAAVVAYLEEGNDKRLGLRPLDGAASWTYEGVTDYALSRNGATLAAAGAEEVFAVSVADGTKTVLQTGKARYAKLTFDADGKRLAYLADGSVHGWEPGTAASLWLKPPAGQTVSDRGAFTFTRNGAALVLGLTTRARGGRAATAAPEPDPDKAVFELWNWKDDRIQTVQKSRAVTDRGRSTPAIFHLAGKKLVMLGDAEITEATVSDEATVALGYSDRGYARLAEFDTRYRDVWVIDAVTGTRQKAVQKTRSTPTLSPDGKWAIYFDNGSWWSIDTRSGKTANLTAQQPVSFAEELHDTPGKPGSNGQAGWTRDSAWFLIYDRYDVWAVRPDGSEAKLVTEGRGRREQIIFRLVRPRADPRDRGIDPSQPLLLSAEKESTRETGFYRDSLQGAAEPVRLILAAKKFSAPVMARQADVAVLTASRFDEFPDLLISDSKFATMRKVSDANPQSKGLRWGTAESVAFKNPDGVSLRATLFKPENFDPKKQYPMIVYIYERLSNNLHNFVVPQPSQNVNAALYVSNGYLVLHPDIAYRAGYPGESALQCVTAAVQKVVDMGFVDEKRIGIQGHSWGGYQIAYMVTRTNRFAAAAPGALVANMTSAYDGIRYGPGIPRQFQYEQGQSRIGGSLWQYPMRYFDNSPLFRADQIQTPLLMLHNDRDDAVPFTQGLEFFLALRRLNKEVYFFNYNGEPHGLRKRANQRDYAIRTFEFFGHFLQGAPKPAWMEKGIPYLDREKPEAQAWRPVASDQKQ